MESENLGIKDLVNEEADEVEDEVGKAEKIEGSESVDPINNREEQMLVFLNHLTGSDYSLDSKGYSEAGKSNGIVDSLAPNDELKKALKTMFLHISRSK